MGVNEEKCKTKQYAENRVKDRDIFVNCILWFLIHWLGLQAQYIYVYIIDSVGF